MSKFGRLRLKTKKLILTHANKSQNPAASKPLANIPPLEYEHIEIIEAESVDVSVIEDIDSEKVTLTDDLFFMCLKESSDYLAYEPFRKRILRESKISFIARLGAGAFETISGEVVKAILFCSKKQIPFNENSYRTLMSPYCCEPIAFVVKRRVTYL